MTLEQLEDLPRRIRRNLDCPMTKMEDRELELMVEPLLQYLDTRDQGPTPPLLGADLYELWQKGARNEVMEKLSSLSSMKASCVVGFMMILLLNDGENTMNNSEAEVFIGTMQERLR
jgi:hypothetical protein